MQSFLTDKKSDKLGFWNIILYIILLKRSLVHVRYLK